MKYDISIILHWDEEKRKEFYAFLENTSYGIVIVQFGHHSAWADNQYFKKNVKKIKSELKHFKNSISFHGPFMYLVPHSEEISIQKISEDIFKKSIEVAIELNSEIIVFHTCINTIISDPSYKKNVIQRQSEFWRKLVDEYKEIEIVIENMWEESPLYFTEILRITI